MLRIPVKPATNADFKPAEASGLKSATWRFFGADRGMMECEGGRGQAETDLGWGEADLWIRGRHTNRKRCCTSTVITHAPET
jgi:hypothetical protein